MRFAAAYLILFRQVGSWNKDGHIVVADIASGLLSVIGRSYVHQHLGFEPLSDVSGWADTVESSAALHFAHSSPYRDCSGPFVMDEAHCPNGQCIVSAINDYAERAGSTELSAADRSEALKFLVHFYADIHQPLHLGFREDRGGDDIPLSSHNGISLHALWDTVLIDRARREIVAAKSKKGLTATLEHFTESLVQEYADMTSSEKSNMLLPSALEIAQETSQMFTCEYAYKDESGAFIPSKGWKAPDQYLSSRARIVRRQLIKAGVRLAAAINSIALAYRENSSGAEFQISARQVVPELPTTSDIDLSNQFEALALDFDIEEIVTDGDVESAEYEPSTAEAPQRKPKASRIIGKITSVDDDMSRLVLIHRNNVYFVTDRALTCAGGYFPQGGHGRWIVCKKPKIVQGWLYAQTTNEFVDEHVLVLFDHLVFGRENPKTAVLVKVMSSLVTQKHQHVVGAAMFAGASKESLYPVPVVDDNNSVPTESDAPELSKSAKQKIDQKRRTQLSNYRQKQVDHFKSKRGSMFFVKAGNFFFIADLATLQQPLEDLMHFNMYHYLDPTSGGTGILLIDRNLYDAELDPQVSSLLSAIAKDSRERTFANVKTRWTLLLELGTIQHALLQVAGNKKQEDSLRTLFNRFVVTPEVSYSRLEWRVDYYSALWTSWMGSIASFLPYV